jgi:hypothetical protein
VPAEDERPKDYLSPCPRCDLHHGWHAFSSLSSARRSRRLGRDAQGKHTGLLIVIAAMAASSGLRVLHLVCVAAILLVATVRAQDDDLLITCYSFKGTAFVRNTKCPNSNTCCGPKATCLSNGLCHNPGDGANTLVRGPCLIKGWDDDCGQICKYSK